MPRKPASRADDSTESRRTAFNAAGSPGHYNTIGRFGEEGRLPEWLRVEGLSVIGCAFIPPGRDLER